MGEQFELKLEIPQKSAPEVVSENGNEPDPNSDLNEYSAEQLREIIVSLTAQIDINRVSDYQERREYEERRDAAERLLAERSADQAQAG